MVSNTEIVNKVRVWISPTMLEIYYDDILLILHRITRTNLYVYI